MSNAEQRRTNAVVRVRAFQSVAAASLWCAGARGLSTYPENTGMTAMAAVRMTLCAAFMVTVVLSKPVLLSEGEDSSSESNSSEETAAHVEPSQEPLQPDLTETDTPNAVEETGPPDAAALLPSADATPSPAALDTSAPPHPEDPQNSTDADALQLMPDDPSQTALGRDVSQDTPTSGPAQDSINTAHVLPHAEASLHPGTTGGTDTTIGVSSTNLPQVTSTTVYHRFPLGATTPFPAPICKQTSLPFSTAPPLQIPLEHTETGVPVCFTFQFVTQEPDPPRGDSM